MNNDSAIRDFTVHGKIAKVYPVRSGNKKDGSGMWQSQDYLIDFEDRDGSSLLVTAWNNRVEQLAIKEGQYLTAHIGFKTRVYGDREFNQITVWKVELDPTRVQP